jgi:hypothetical protein
MTKSFWRYPAFWAIAVFLVALGIFMAFAVFGIQTLFYNTEVNEDFEAPAPATAEQGSRRADSAATRLDLHLVQTLLGQLRYGPFAVGPTCPTL